ncbi:sugar ABC transporter periplasmic protein [Rhodococcus sp. ACS1]|nr:sugar ABC transporter periplasmic protein [Rhodococcus sp. ACS1]
MKVLCATVVLGVALALTACDSTSSAAGDGSVNTHAVQIAQAEVDTHLADATNVGVTESTSGAPRRGLRFAYVGCALPTCATFRDGMTAAADAIGATVTTLTYQGTPESIQSAFDNAVQLHPDAIFSTGTPPSATVKQREEMKRLGIPFIDNSAIYEPDPKTATGTVDNDPAPPTVLFEPASMVRYMGQLLADWAITQSGGNVNSIFVNVPDFPIVVPPQVGYEDRLAELCPDTCSNTNINGTANDIGTAIPSKVVSALQQHPDTNYIVFTAGDFSLGVLPAVRAAGFTDVKLIGNSPIADNIAGLTAGDQNEAWLGVSNQVLGWRYVDAAVRALKGDAIPSPVADSPDDTTAAAWPWIQILTKDTAPTEDPWITPRNYRELFLTMWNLPVT